MSNDKDKITLVQLQLELSREETKRIQIHEEEETKRSLIDLNRAQIELQRLILEGIYIHIYV